MKKPQLFFLSLLVSTLTILWADDHDEREKDSRINDPRRGTREKQDRMHQESRKIHEAVVAGEMSHEEGRKKLMLFNAVISSS